MTLANAMRWLSHAMRWLRHARAVLPALAAALKAMTGIDVDATAFDEDLLPDYLRFRVQVVDAAGLVHLRKTMDGGETVSINGTLPLSVVIGRANAIDVVVRGEPFDVQAVAKDNVARFQIK